MSSVCECPGCGAELEYTADMCGATVECAACNTQFVLPGADDVQWLRMKLDVRPAAISLNAKQKSADSVKPGKRFTVSATARNVAKPSKLITKIRVNRFNVPYAVYQ